MKYDMRAKGTGSYDHKTKCWRLRGKGIHVTLRQLENKYGVKFTATEPERLKRESVTYWRKWLQDTEDDRLQAQRDAKAATAFAPLRSSLRGMIRPTQGRKRL